MQDILMKIRIDGFFSLLLILFLCVGQTIWANNQRQLYAGIKNFYDVTTLIERRYESEVDFADLYEEAWFSLQKKTWEDINDILPNADTILAATLAPDSSSREIRNFYARRIENTLTLFSKAQTDDATPTVRDLWNISTAGLVASLGDQYSQFLPAKENQRLQDSLSGKPDEEKVFYGVGISVEWDTVTDLGVLVIAPLPGTPAERNDVRAGDIIIGVNGEYFRDWEDDYAKKLEKAIKLITGEKDTEVTLTIKKADVPEPVDITLTRAPINPEQLISKEMLDDKIGLIRLASFYANAADDLLQAMRYLKLEGMEKLILDLRYNPGGYLDQAVKVADTFLKKDDLITYTYGRSSPHREFKDQETDTEGFSDIPLIVLINQFSASASEVVTGALKDNKRAFVVGETSFGKGSVQEVFQLQDEAGLRLTVAHYYSPSGVCIHEIGIRPDLIVERISKEDLELLEDKDYTHVSRKDRMFDFDYQLKAAYQVHAGEIKVDEIKVLADVQQELEKSHVTVTQDISSSTEEIDESD
jgi:carboxyl-terminal processing protease